jgi:hypothetical protein
MPLSKSVPFPTQPAGAGERGFAFLEGKGGFISPKPTSPWMAATAILGAPGLYNDSQIVGWKQVTDAVHAKGGTIFLQLYHAGRQSNSQLQPGGGAPVGPSEVLHGGVDGDDRRHAVHSLVGHGVAIGLTIFLSRGCLPQRGIAARHILALQLATLVSEALQR